MSHKRFYRVKLYAHHEPILRSLHVQVAPDHTTATMLQSILQQIEEQRIERRLEGTTPSHCCQLSFLGALEDQEGN